MCVCSSYQYNTIFALWNRNAHIMYDDNYSLYIGIQYYVDTLLTCFETIEIIVIKHGDSSLTQCYAGSMSAWNVLRITNFIIRLPAH